MPYFELKLEKFQFPKDLDNKYANFRFNVDLRFINDQGQYATKQAVMPSLDTFWECATNKKDEPNYVRDDEYDKNNNSLSQFDEEVLHEWDRLILLVKGTSVHSILFTVNDVDRKDIWDKVQDFVMKILEATLLKIKDAIPGNLPLSLPDSLGETVDDLQSFMLKKISGGDTILFRRSIKLEAPPDGNWQVWENCPNECPQEFTIDGRGTKGEYQIVFSVTKIPQSQ